MLPPVPSGLLMPAGDRASVASSEKMVEPTLATDTKAPLLGVPSRTRKVSFGSMSVSPLMATVIVLLVWPGAKAMPPCGSTPVEKSLAVAGVGARPSVNQASVLLPVVMPLRVTV